MGNLLGHCFCLIGFNRQYEQIIILPGQLIHSGEYLIQMGLMFTPYPLDPNPLLPDCVGNLFPIQVR